MKQLQAACRLTFSQLHQVAADVLPEDFVKPSAAISGATIGQHLRHTVEFFLCLERGVQSGVVCYDRRAHDRRMEADKLMALSALAHIQSFIDQQVVDMPLVLELSYERQAANFTRIDTHYRRELAYTIEHAVHHMALIKVALREVAPYVALDPNFGVAVSTVRHQQRVLGEAV